MISLTVVARKLKLLGFDKEADSITKLSAEPFNSAKYISERLEPGSGPIKQEDINPTTVNEIISALNSYFNRIKEKYNREPKDTYLFDAYNEVEPKNVSNREYRLALDDVATCITIGSVLYTELDAALKTVFSE